MIRSEPGLHTLEEFSIHGSSDHDRGTIAIEPGSQRKTGSLHFNSLPPPAHSWRLDRVPDGSSSPLSRRTTFGFTCSRCAETDRRVPRRVGEDTLFPDRVVEPDLAVVPFSDGYVGVIPVSPEFRTFVQTSLFGRDVPVFFELLFTGDSPEDVIDDDPVQRILLPYHDPLGRMERVIGPSWDPAVNQPFQHCTDKDDARQYRPENNARSIVRPRKKINPSEPRERSVIMK